MPVILPFVFPYNMSNFHYNVDVDGLKEIGWTDTDISNFQDYSGIDWDNITYSDYSVTSVEKGLYQDYLNGTHKPAAFNGNGGYYATLYPNMRYYPKISFGTTTGTFQSYWAYCKELIALPEIADFPVDGAYMNGNALFAHCDKLRYIPNICTKNTTYWYATNFNSFAYNCPLLNHIDYINMYNSTVNAYAFTDCPNLTYVGVKLAKSTLDFRNTLLKRATYLEIFASLQSVSSTSGNTIYVPAYTITGLISGDTSTATNKGWKVVAEYP